MAQGSATFSSQGSQLTIQTSDRAQINWQSFNIGLGETTTFVQPSSSSVVWNQINDSNPSQILGSLNANGLVVLQNQAGFYVGGQASIHTGGLLMTTAPTVPIDLMSGGLWQFNGPPPTASIINYGQITAGAGGPVFLIARNIENHGTITAPGGNVGLYAGRKVLVSDRPDGRGLSAEVQLPQGSVDNEGRIIANGGTIALHAQVVNEGGLIQANSVREQNGVIELVASDNLHLSASANLSARGDSQGTSSGGSVVMKSNNQYSDASGSTISVAGGSQGGAGGQVEISAPNMTAIQAHVNGSAANGFSQGQLLIDPYNIDLTATGASAGSGTVNLNDPPAASGSTLSLDPNSFADFSDVNLTLQAANDITLDTGWSLADSSTPRMLTLQAGNNITLNASLSAGANWGVTMVAGADFTTPTSVTPSVGGIYLKGNSFLQAQDGSLSLWAGNEVTVQKGAIRTLNGGNINVTAVSGDVNTGTNPNGYLFGATGTGYSVNGPALGGISTAAGGDVTITAGGNVTSYLPTGISSAQADAGSGAFGSEPGVVTVTAGGSVRGHFVAADSERDGQLVASTITAQNGNAGDFGNYLALSLVKGGWDVNAPNGSIYLQEVRNPNGIFNNKGFGATPLKHLFDYDPNSFVSLDAADTVNLEGTLLPRDSVGDSVQVIYPPSLTIAAGSGGVTLGNNLTLFPSPSGELSITTTGSGPLQTSQSGTSYELLMSDSGSTRWTGANSFGDSEHAATPVQLDNPNPVVINIAGGMNDVYLNMPKATQITVGGNMNNSSFVGQNLHASDVTSINVAGQIWNRNDYTFATLSQGLSPIVAYPGAIPDYFEVLRDAVSSSGAPLFSTLPFTYDPATKTLGFHGRMDYQTEQTLLGQLQVITYGPDGKPVLDPTTGTYVTQTESFGVDPSVIADLYARSQDIPQQSPQGYQINGPGQFDITATSLDLGVTRGVISQGPALNNSLAALPDAAAGAAINVNLQGDLNMFSSTIASFFGGDININSGGAVNVGSQLVLANAAYPRGIFTSGRGDVQVIAGGDVNVQGSRIAAYNGGNVLVESLKGNVNAGSGGASQVNVQEVSVDPITYAVSTKLQPIVGSGILATTLPDAPKGEAVGNITVETPQGNIIASQGGILQIPLNGNTSLDPTLTLAAGTRDADGNVVYSGNIDAGGSGVIGINTKLSAAGDIIGFVFARGDSSVSAAANVSGTFLAAGSASFNAGGTVSGTLIGLGGISASGGSVTATLLSQNVSVNGAAGPSALASAATVSASSQSAAQSSDEQVSQKVASADTGDQDDLKKRRKKKPELEKSVGRVTVILPKS